MAEPEVKTSGGSSIGLFAAALSLIVLLSILAVVAGIMWEILPACFEFGQSLFD